MLRLKIFICAVDREVEHHAFLNKRLGPLAHFFSLPGGDGPFVSRKFLIREDQIFIQPHYSSKAFTGFAGAVGVVKIEKIGIWLFERNSVSLKLVAELHFLPFSEGKGQVTMAFVKCCLNRICRPTLQIL